MKKIVALTLALMILAAAPAFAALRILPDDVQDRLHGLALDLYPGHEVSESWLQEFVATGPEVFVVILIKNHDEKVTVYVDAIDEVILSGDEFDAIVEAEVEAQIENPIYTTLGIDTNDDEAAVTPIRDPGNNAPWIAGGLVMLALAGGVALYIKKK